MTGKGVGQSSQLCQVSIGQAESQLPYNTQIMSSPSFHWTCSWTSVPASLFVDLPSSFSCPSSCPQADLMGRLTTQEDFAPGCTLPWALQSQLHLHRPSFLNMASLSSFQVFIQALPLPWNALYVFFWGGEGCHAARGILVLRPGSNLCPLHWKYGDLSTVSPGSPYSAVLVTLFLFSHHLMPTFFLLQTHTKKPPHAGSPLGRARRAFSWDIQ